MKGMNGLERMSQKLRERGVCTPEEAEFIRSIVKIAREKGVQVKEEGLCLEPFSHKLPDIPAPDGLSFMEHQKIVAWLLEKQSLVLADNVGLGKTVSAIAAMNLLKPKRVLLVVPAFLKPTWERELDRWILYSPDITLLSYEKFIKHPDGVYDLAVFDEAHQLKGISMRTQKMLSTRAGRFLFMTATPIFTSPADMCFILNKAKNPEFIPRRSYEIKDLYWDFARKYCYTMITPYGQKAGRVKSPLALRADYAEVFLRRRTQDVLSDLPQRRYAPIWLEAKDQKLIELIKEELAHYLQGKDSDHLSHVRQRIALEKIPYVIALAKEVMESEDRLIIVAWHRDVVKAIDGVLSKEGLKTLKITSETPQWERDRIVKEFQEGGGKMILVGTMGAMGMGLTLTRASHMIMAELDFVPSRVVQAMGRIHRIGTQRSPLYYFPMFAGSVEEKIYEILSTRSLESEFLISQDSPLPQENTSRGIRRRR